MNGMHVGRWIVMVALGLAVSSADLVAQGGAGRAGAGARGALPGARGAQVPGGRRLQLENQIWATHQNQVARELRLDAGTRQRFQEVSEEFRRRRTALTQEERAVRAREQAAFQGGAGAEDPRQIIESLIRLREQEAAIFREETERFLEFMEPAQVLRIFRRRAALTEQIRQLGGGRAGGRGGVDGGVDGGTPLPGGLPGG